MDVVVFGNANLDVLCYPVDEVPRYDSIGFEHGSVSAGGCGSNVAVVLAALGAGVGLAARVGQDEPGRLLGDFWVRAGVDTRLVRQSPGGSTGISVGLVDSQRQPRFVHMPGVNASLTVDDLYWPAMERLGVRALHIAGFFVLPGLLDGRLPQALARARRNGWLVTLDVVDSPAMREPKALWPCLPHLDVFLCNRREAAHLTGEGHPPLAAENLRQRGAKAVVIKMGEKGCWLAGPGLNIVVPAQEGVQVVDTTGAGDAFAAGLLAACLEGQGLVTACRAGSAAGARTVGALGAVAAWLPQA